MISNSGIEVPGISLIKDFHKAQREYHQAWVAGNNQETTPFVWSLVLVALATFGTPPASTLTSFRRLSPYRRQPLPT